MSKIYKRQSAAKKQLNDIWNNPNNVNVIHYSCESFYNRPHGASPRITSIAIRNLGTAQTRSFSIHQFAELNGYSACNIKNHYDKLEKEMLDAFCEFVKKHKTYKWIHWNMRDVNYGFHAIELRHKILEGNPEIIEDDRKFDLARLLYEIYGKNYAKHGKSGRLQSLMDMNNIRSKHSKTGEEEANLFEEGKFVTLHQSTLAKVDKLADICQLAYENDLKTDAKFWDLHDYGIKTIAILFHDHPYISSFLSVSITLLSVVISIVLFFAGCP